MAPHGADAVAAAGKALLSAALMGSPRAPKGPNVDVVDPEEAPEEKPGQDHSAAAGWLVLRLALGWSPLCLATGGQKAPDSPDSVTRQRSFDMTDCLERGLARETATDFTMPLRRSHHLWRFQVACSDCRQDARLVSEDGDFLMYAKLSAQDHRVCFYLYDPGGEAGRLFDPDSPAFSMSFNEARTEWRLVQERCEHCQLAPAHLSCAGHGKQQMAFFRHSRRIIGDGICNCMEVWIPGIFSDGSSIVWCPMLGHGALEACSGQCYEVQRLVTRQPIWNDQVESLVLDFKGRDVEASARNFQLALRQKPSHVICQFGKLGRNSFSLDLRYPLNLIQTFAMAMSTAFWK